jgi:hypothetical protein
VFDWLFEGRPSVYLVLAFFAIIALAWWAQTGFVLVRDAAPSRDKPEKVKHRLAWPLVILGVVFALGLAWYLLDHLVETPREQMKRKIGEMARAVEARDIDGIFLHISDRFRFRNLDKAGFRRFVEGVAGDGGVRKIKVWDFKFPEQTGKLEFRTSAEGPLVMEPNQAYVRAEFVLEEKGQWRLKGFEIFNPVVDSNSPWSLPGLPEPHAPGPARP